LKTTGQVLSADCGRRQKLKQIHKETKPWSGKYFSY